MKCKDCGCEIYTEGFEEEGEIVDCPSCGAEYRYCLGKFIYYEFEGEDWGE